MLAKPTKNLFYCLGIATVIFAACKKNNDSPVPFTEGGYSGRLISTSVQGGNTIQTVLPANISFIGGNYTANYIPQNQLPYTDYIPVTGTYQLQAENTVLVLTSSLQVQPLPVINLLDGQFTISYKADSLILTRNLSDGLLSYQYRLKKNH
jgi:hypothetical protein